jgi:hypothetical protein
MAGTAARPTKIDFRFRAKNSQALSAAKHLRAAILCPYTIAFQPNRCA